MITDYMWVAHVTSLDYVVCIQMPFYFLLIYGKKLFLVNSISCIGFGLLEKFNAKEAPYMKFVEIMYFYEMDSSE